MTNPHQCLQLSAGRGGFASFRWCCGIEGCFGQWQDGISGCFSEKVLGCVLWCFGKMVLALSSYALPFFFPKLSVLLFVKQVASYVKMELNLRQDSQG